LKVELGFAEGAVLLCGSSFWASSAWRGWRQRRGINPPGLFLIPVVFSSGANGKVGEAYTGVQGRRLVIFLK
jgi:hypothetical protein